MSLKIKIWLLDTLCAPIIHSLKEFAHFELKIELVKLTAYDIRTDHSRISSDIGLTRLFPPR